MTADPRTDPVGTVRQDPTGRIAVKTTMGGDTGGGHHVWCFTDENLEHRWLHHVEVAWWRVLSSPLPDSETEWQWGIKVHDGSIMPLIHGDTEARARSMRASSKRGALVVRREVGPWTEVQP